MKDLLLADKIREETTCIVYDAMYSFFTSNPNFDPKRGTSNIALHCHIDGRELTDSDSDPPVVDGHRRTQADRQHNIDRENGAVDRYLALGP